MEKRNKKGVVIDNLVWWIIAIAVLVIILVLAVLLRGKLTGLGDYLKNLFRFGR